jgi:hypothetical protein
VGHGLEDDLPWIWVDQVGLQVLRISHPESQHRHRLLSVISHLTDRHLPTLGRSR